MTEPEFEAIVGRELEALRERLKASGIPALRLDANITPRGIVARAWRPEDTEAVLVRVTPGPSPVVIPGPARRASRAPRSVG